MASCVVIEHGPSERSFLVGEALASALVPVDIRRPYHGDAIPTSAAGLSGVVVLGGEVSAASDSGFPSRRSELALLRDAVGRGVPVLGVCLGAQLLAKAGGAKVFAGPAGLEIGWTPVRLRREAFTDPLFHGLPPQLCVLNWHGDTFELPPGGVALATGRTYPNQAFRLGDRAWGLQFHIEVDAGAVDEFLATFADEATQAGVGAAGLAQASVAALAELAPARDLILARFAALVAREDRRAAARGRLELAAEDRAIG